LARFTIRATSGSTRLPEFSLQQVSKPLDTGFTAAEYRQIAPLPFNCSIPATMHA
jgi:hypothetical protein